MPTPALRSRRPAALPAPPFELATDTYITDGRNLFRCVSAAPAHDLGATALLEDCKTLELCVLSLEELDPEEFRIVEPAMGDTGLEPVTSCV
jgi:hypothetical protein